MSDVGPAPVGARALRALAVTAVALVPVGALLALWLANDGDDLELLLARLLFWTMPAVLAFVAVGAVWRWRARSSPADELLRAAAPGAAYAAALTVLLFWLVPPTMRVQFDETSLVGVSQNMARLEAAVMTTGAIPYDGDVFPLENTVDKRPPLFAFLVQLVHRVAGYRVANAFAVNGALLALGLFVVFGAVRARLGLAAAFAAPLCLLGVPLTGIVATSAGFELMAAVWFVVALLAALEFVARPDDARFAGLLAAGMLFAQSRYESLPAALLLAGLVAWRVRGRFRPAFGGWLLLAVAPALLLPLGFLLLHAQNPKFYPEAAGAPLVSLTHLAAHVGPFLVAWFDPRLANPLPGVLAVAAVLVVGARLWRREARANDALVAVPVLVVTAIALMWFYGDVGELTALRLFLPCAWLCALAPLGAFAWLRGRAVPAAALLALCAGHAALRGRELVAGRAFPELQIAALTEALDTVVARLPGDRATTLWVGAPAQYLIVRGRAALSPDGFARRTADLQQLSRRGELRTTYVLETPIDAAMAPALGSPRDVLQRWPSDVVEEIGGRQPITVHRLR